MESVEQGGVRMEWDPQKRLIQLTHPRGAACGEKAAIELCDTLDAWVDDQPFVILADIPGGGEADVSFRLEWTRRMQKYAGRAKIACYHASGMDAVTLAIFAKMSGVDTRPFDSEEEARKWLGVE